MDKIYFSIVMAAYNSEDTIERALKSIRSQKFRQEEIEILVVDGGSTDKTLEIAKKYNAVILQNPYKLPEPAKTIGLKHASGKYVCIMDTDEEIPDITIFQQRKAVLEHYNEIKCLAIGLLTPNGSRPCCYYINAVGDPFTCFVYSTFKDSMEGLIVKKGKFVSEYNCYIAQYSENDIKPIGDSGIVMDLRYIRDNYNDLLDDLTTSDIFDMIIADTGYVGYIKYDNHYHYTSASIETFLKKVKFRIINNIFDVKGSGYSSKAQRNKKLFFRKYLFPIYAICIIVPLFEGIRMAFNYKHWIFLMHPLFCLYVIFEIFIQYSCKLLGIKKKNADYAKN